MICLIANNHFTAAKFASAQNLESCEWFYLSDVSDVIHRSNFHVLVVPPIFDDKLAWFEKIYTIAKKRGAIGRS